MRVKTANLVCASVIIIFSLVMRSELEDVPLEGVIFPMSIIWCLLACSFLLAARSLFIPANEKVSFFANMPPLRWCVACGLFLLQAWGSMYLSFRLMMGLCMFIMLVYLAPEKNIRSICADILFTAGFLCFFHFFFTEVMHIYFPEELF